MIRWSEVAAGAHGLRMYRVEANAGPVLSAGGEGIGGRMMSWVSRREGFLRTKSAFLRECGFSGDLGEVERDLRERFAVWGAARGIDLSAAPWGSETDGQTRVDRAIDPGDGVVPLAGGRVEVLRFDGHLPGHLCVWVDRAHFVSGDMWLPATTSLVTPGRIAALAGVPGERCGVLRYLESNERLLAMRIDDALSYPSHEIIFRNPKRMAMRDLEVLAERMSGVMRVLAEHRHRPMRTLDLAWGAKPSSRSGSSRAARIGSRSRTTRPRLMCRISSCSATSRKSSRSDSCGPAEARSRLASTARARARAEYGHLEFRSRGAA